MIRQNPRRYRALRREPAIPAPPGVVDGRTGIVLLDTRAIRKKALKAYHDAERRLDDLKAQLSRFHEHDVPGFRQWMHKECGPLLSRQRELICAISEKQNLLLDVEEWATLHGVSFEAAYRKILWRRANPREAEEEDRKQAEEAARRFGADRDKRDGERDDFVEPDDDAWNEFADVFERMAGNGPASHSAGKDKSADTENTKSARELYRIIVRRLHPDHHGHMNEARKNLWHEVQTAYRAHDVNALYSILARCDTGKGGIGEHTPVSMIRRLIRQFKKSMRSVGNQVRQVKMDKAWDFESRIDDRHFTAQIRFELQDEINSAERHLNRLLRTIARLDRAVATTRKHDKRGPGHVKP